MKIKLLTDAPKHNLALMKLSAYHKSIGDEIVFNMPVFSADYTYASVLFEKNKNKFIADEYGGPAYVNPVERQCSSGYNVLPREIEQTIPDYSLYNLDYSIGYTFRP